MELKELVFKVITSWQVLTVTAVLIAYVFLVQYVSRLYRRGKPIPMPKVGKKTKHEDNAGPETGGDDDLGLEEKDAQ
jgi:hypothetical protein